jgi:peptide/nickel transport system permease protein
MFVVRRLVALVATVVLAPCLTYVVFDMLAKPYFAPGETLDGLLLWLENWLLHGSLGYSSYYRGDITWVIRLGLPADLTMLFGGLIIGLVAGVGAGLLAVAHPRSPLQRVFDFLAGLGVSMPVYWMGFVILVLFAHNSGMIAMIPFVSGQADYEELPSDPLAFVQSLWIPCVVVATPLAAGVYRMTLAASRDVLGEDFVRTAYAKGLPLRRVLFRHVFPVAAVPVLMLAAVQVNLMLTNIGLMQVAFNIPGSFREIQPALANGDVDMIQALVVLGVAIIAIFNAAADLLQMHLDPRVREATYRRSQPLSARQPTR